MMFLLESRQVFPFAYTGGRSQEAIHQKSHHAISQLFTLSLRQCPHYHACSPIPLRYAILLGINQKHMCFSA